MSTFCPIKTSEEYIEMMDVFKDSAYVHQLWDLNKGNPLDKDPWGKPSLLFEDLMGFTDGDRVEALRLKSIVYNQGYLKEFGNWLDVPLDSSKYDVYENGEPFMDTFLNTDYFDNKKTVHADPIIQKAIEKYGDLINDFNNPYTWELEREYGLLDETHPFKVEQGEQWRVKQLKGFTFDKALSIINKIKETGAMASPVDVFYPGTVKKSRTGVKVGVSIGIPINKTATTNNRTSSTINIAGQLFTVRYRDHASINELMRKTQLSNLDGMSMLAQLLKEHSALISSQPELLTMIKLFMDNRNKNSNIKVNIKQRNATNDYMDYDPKDHSINLYRDTILEQPSLDAFVNAFTHEIGHAFLNDALDHPSDEIDEQFGKTMKEVWADYKTQPTLTNENAAEDVHEFLSNFITDSKLKHQLREMTSPSHPKNLLQRVLDAIIQWLRRKTGYRTRKEYGENLNDVVNNALTTFINNRMQYRNPDNYKKEQFFTKRKAKVRKELVDIQQHVDVTKPETFKTALDSLSKLFDIRLTKKEHSYIHKASGVSFKSITTLNAENGYGISESKIAKMTPEQLEVLKRAESIGTAHHMGMEELVTEVALDIKGETGFAVSDNAKEMLATILKDIKKSKTPRGGSITILSEVFIADIDKQVAGTIDMVIIDNLGRIHIYDFKTKEKGFKYYADSKFGKSNKETYQLQLGSYKHLLEKFLGVQVASMNVVMLKPTIDLEHKVISTVSLDTSYSITGIDTFTKEPTSVYNVYGENPKRFSWSRAESKLSADADITTNPSYRLASVQADKLNNLDAIYKKTLEVLEDKLAIMRKRYTFTKRRSFEEHFNEVSQIDSTSAAIFSIVKYADKVTTELKNKYYKMLQEGKVFTPQMLQEWRDYITAYDSLDGLQALLSENPKLLDDKEKPLTNEPTAMMVLDNMIKNKKIIKDVYELKGKESVAKRLTPFFHMIEVQRKEELQSFYRRLEHRVKHGKEINDFTIRGKAVSGVMSREEFEQYGKDMNEFVDYHMSKEKADIERATYELLLKELSVAANDVNEVTRWIDALSDTTDPVAAAIVSAFSHADETSRLEALDAKIKVLRVLKELEEFKGKTGFTSEKEFYKSILEIGADGELTNYLIRPWLSSLDLEEKIIRAENRRKPEADAGTHMKAWIDHNFPLDTHEDAYFEAFDKHLLAAFEAKKITFAEKEAIMLNETDRKLPLSMLTRPLRDEYGHMIEDTQLSEEAAEIAINWKAKNRKLYSDIHEKWINPQWNVFLRESGVSTDIPVAEQFLELSRSKQPMAKFYTLMTELVAEADSGVPYSYRLGFRLPGVYKNKNERLREGQSLATSFKETVSLGFLRRDADILRNSQEFTDENGKPKYFLPIHYINKLTPDEQSYDLASIYLLHWESANDYANKREILPTIEMAKQFVEDRKTERRDSMGKRILRAIKSDREGSDQESSVVSGSNLAAQLKDWFEMYVYGNTVEKSEIALGDELVLDLQKFTDALNGFTSLNLLAFNVVQGFANIAVGEIFQSIESVAGEYMSKSAYTKATLRYSKWLPGMLGDIGRRAPEHVGSLLIERFNAMNEDVAADISFANLNKIKALAKKEAFAFMQNGGEHWLRARFLYGILEHEIRAISKSGEDLGPMIDQYYAEDGELKIRDEVDLEKSKWTLEEQELWGRRFRGIADRVHGAYSQEARVAAQRYVIGKLAYMFRKFVMPGVRRRYGKQVYSERLQQTTEGNYITTFKFFKKLAKEMKGMSFALMSEEWAALSPHEQANIKRTISEIATLTSLIILANFAYTNWSDGEDEGDKRFWAFLAYQSYRLKSEMLFYVSPANAMQILRSPMASMSVLENIGKTWQQMFNPFEEYQRGPWKGHLKLTRDIIQFVPVYKQYYKMRDIEEQIQWFR